MRNRCFQLPRERINFFRLLDVPAQIPLGDVFPRGNGMFVRSAESGEQELVVEANAGRQISRLSVFPFGPRLL